MWMEKSRIKNLSLFKMKSKVQRKIYFSLILIFLLFGVLIYGFGSGSEKKSSYNKASNTVSEPKVNETPLGWPWHGVVVSTHYDINVDRDLTELKERGVNFVTIYLKPRKLAKFENLSGEEAFQMSLKKADEILDKCKELGLYSMISLSEFPIESEKKLNQNQEKFWDSPRQLSSAVNKIKEVILHFRTRGQELQAYQFITEPVSIGANGKAKKPVPWDKMFKEVHSFLTKKDTGRYIVYSPGPWGSPESFKNLEPIIPDSKIIYSFHYYLPHKYSHQGIRKYDNTYAYPGIMGQEYWNKEKILSSLTPIVNFKKKYNKLILVGEFSAVYSAKGWEQYLRDQLELYQEYNFGYTYFTFNGYREWAVSDKNQSPISKKKFGKFNLDSREKRLNLLSQYWKH
jgi:hypothetical protein